MCMESVGKEIKSKVILSKEMAGEESSVMENQEKADKGLTSKEIASEPIREWQVRKCK